MIDIYTMTLDQKYSSIIKISTNNKSGDQRDLYLLDIIKTPTGWNYQLANKTTKQLIKIDTIINSGSYVIDNIYDLALHDIKYFTTSENMISTSVLRVHNGWVYLKYNTISLIAHMFYFVPQLIPQTQDIANKIEDLNDNNSVTLLASEAGTWHEYSNDGNEYTYRNCSGFWDQDNKILNFDNEQLDTKIDIILKTVVVTTSSNSLLHVELYIPHPSGDIHVGGQTVLSLKNGVAHRESIAYHVYNGAYVKEYGLKIRTKIDTSLKSDTTLSDRQILVRV